jgi:signal transduction histidine kinase
MSVTVTAAGERAPEGSPRPTHRIPSDKVAVAVVVALDVGILAVGIAVDGVRLLDLTGEIAVWAVAAAAVGAAAIQLSGGEQLGLDMPLLLAAGFVLGPVPAGVLALVGYVDLREIRGDISIGRALFNRSQTSLSAMGAAGIYGLLNPQGVFWPTTILAAIAAVCVDVLLNVTLVSGIVALHERLPPTVSVHRLRLGSVVEFTWTYACFGLLSLLLAETYKSTGGWSLFLMALPLLLARKAFSQASRLDTAESRLRVQQEALEQASRTIVDERRDERLAIAAGLHDDVLPPLYRVHLLGQVLRQELATGQLLAMEDDLPLLVNATAEASQSVRGLIQNLRLSPLGAGGLARTLGLLIDQLKHESDVEIRGQLEDVRGSPVIELLTYQVAREAIRNALRHASASRVDITLRRDAEDIRLIVSDDGSGFSPSSVDPSSHFGLALMRERVELGGGVLRVESSPGLGTTVVARLPASRGDTSVGSE